VDFKILTKVPFSIFNLCSFQNLAEVIIIIKNFRILTIEHFRIVTIKNFRILTIKHFKVLTIKYSRIVIKYLRIAIKHSIIKLDLTKCFMKSSVLPYLKFKKQWH